MLSDSESSDSDSGIRFKVDSIRRKETGSSFSAKKDRDRADRRATDGRNHDDKRPRGRSRDGTRVRNHDESRSKERQPERRRSRSRDDSRRKNRSKSTDRRKQRSQSRSKDRRRDECRSREGSSRRSSRSRDVRRRSRSPAHEFNDEKQRFAEGKSRSRRSSYDDEEYDRQRKYIRKSNVEPEPRSDKAHKSDDRKPSSKDSRRAGRSQKEQSVEPVASRRDDGNDQGVSGPSLPQHLTKSADEYEPDVCGPSLPPHMLSKATGEGVSDAGKSTQRSPTPDPESSKNRVVGPVLPNHINLEALASFQTHSEIITDISDSDVEDDANLIGPALPGTSRTDAQLELERRALELKLAQLNDSDAEDNNEPTRDEWMTALPDVRKVAGMGLVARQFKTKAGPELGDRSGWTDTPSDRARRAQQPGPTPEEVILDRQRDAEAIFRAKRDAEQEKAVSKHKKKHKRNQSLLDIHQKKLKKKKNVCLVDLYLFSIYVTRKKLTLFFIHY